jgi:dephospho-CoA kinase
VARVIGLTGGIASGKSTVADMLRSLGAAIVDADLLARQVVEHGTPAAREIRKRFGDQVFAADGSLDRKALGAIVFADPEARAALGRITHPRIAMLSQQRIAELAAAGHDPVIYEAALIVENQLHHAMAGLIVVAVPEHVQLERLMARDGIDETAARERISSQLPLAEKRAVADWVVDNIGPLEDTRRQVEELWSSFSNQS